MTTHGTNDLEANVESVEFVRSVLFAPSRLDFNQMIEPRKATEDLLPTTNGDALSQRR